MIEIDEERTSANCVSMKDNSREPAREGQRLVALSRTLTIGKLYQSYRLADYVESESPSLVQTARCFVSPDPGPWANRGRHHSADCINMPEPLYSPDDASKRLEFCAGAQPLGMYGILSIWKS
jgi:hypothetical protein